MVDGSPNAYAFSSSFFIILLLPQSCTHQPLRGCAPRGEVNQPMAHCGYPPLQIGQVKVKLQRPPTDLGSSLGLGLGLGLGFGFGLMNDIAPFRPRAYAIIRHISTGMICACGRFVTCIHPYLLFIFLISFQCPFVSTTTPAANSQCTKHPYYICDHGLYDVEIHANPGLQNKSV